MQTILRVVIADNNETFARSLKESLVECGGYEVVASSGDGEEVVRLVQKHAADVLIMDPMLIQLDGIGVLGKLEKGNVHPLVVAVSSFSSEYMKQQMGSMASRALCSSPAAWNPWCRR